MLLAIIKELPYITQTNALWLANIFDIFFESYVFCEWRVRNIVLTVSWIYGSDTLNHATVTRYFF